MSVDNRDMVTKPDLLDFIEQQIVRRTRGGVHQLRVQSEGERLIISGYTSSYYVKQLAIHAILESVEPSMDARLMLDIQVIPTSLRHIEPAPRAWQD